MARRFTPDQKHRIIYRYRKGDLTKVIAHDFGTSTATICSIVHRAGERRRIGERKFVEHPVPAKMRVWWHRRRKEIKRYVRAWLDQASTPSTSAQDAQPRHE